MFAEQDHDGVLSLIDSNSYRMVKMRPHVTQTWRSINSENEATRDSDNEDL